MTARGAQRVVIVGGDLGYLVRFRGQLLRALVAGGHDVIVAAPKTDPSAPGRLEAMGVTYHRASLNRTGMNPLRDLRDQFAMARWFREVRPDVVFAYGAKPIVVALAAASFARVPRRYAMLAGLGFAFAFTHDGQRSVKRALARQVQKAMYRWLFPSCERVIFHNHEDRDELVRRRLVALEHTTVVAGSGVDVAEFTATVPPTTPPTFMFVGRMLRSKGVEELVRAAHQLRAKVPDAEVHLVGGMDQNPDAIDVGVLRAAVDQGDVVYHGQIADVRPYLRACSVFVLPSYREGLPRSALEALASGRTTIVSDAPGCREVVRHGRHGALVPVRNVPALAATMIEYARDPERIVREGAEARRTAEEDYDVRIVTESMLAALDLAGDASVS